MSRRRVGLITLMRVVSVVLVLCVLAISALLMDSAARNALDDAVVRLDRGILDQTLRNIEMAYDEMSQFLFNLSLDEQVWQLYDRLSEEMSRQLQPIEIIEKGKELSGYLNIKRYIYNVVSKVVLCAGNVRVGSDNTIMPQDAPGDDSFALGTRLNSPLNNAVYAYTFSLKNPLNDAVIQYVEGTKPTTRMQTVYEGRTAFFFRVPAREDVWIVLVVKRDWLRDAVQSDADIIVTDTSGAALYAQDKVRAELFQAWNPGQRDEMSQSVQTFNDRSYRLSAITNHPSWRVALIADNQKANDALKIIRLMSASAVLVLTMLSDIFFSRLLRSKLNQYLRFIEDTNAYPVIRPQRETGPHREPSLRRSMLTYFLTVLCTSSLLFCGVTMGASVRLIEDAVRERDRQFFTKQLYSIDSLHNRSLKILYSVAFNTDLRDMLTGNASGAHPFSSFLYSFNEVCELNLYALDGSLIYATSYANASDTLQIFPTSRTQWIFGQSNRLGKQVIKSVARLTEYRLDNPSLKPAGYLEVVYQTDRFGLLIQSANGLGMDCCVVGPGDLVVAASDSALIGKKLDDAQLERLTMRLDARGVPLSLLAGEREAGWMRAVWSYWPAVGLLTAVVLSLCAILTLAVTRVIEIQVAGLVGCLMEVGNGRGVPELPSRWITEIDHLYIAFLRMSDRIDRLIEDEYAFKLNEVRLQNERNESDLIALQAQINPHFLFNMLESIRWLMQDGDTSRCETTITLLGNLLRYSMKISQPVVSIYDEVNMARTYVQLQKMRLKHELEVTFSIDDSVKNAKTLRMALQPLIENTFAHGISKARKDGLVMISAIRDDDVALIRVEDNGRGMTEDALAALRCRIGGEEQGERIGLVNVNRRIQLFFGASYGIEVDNRQEGGFIVTIRQPLDIIT